ncbi:DUF1684 domain-containing protein [Streptomyces sp. NPDC091273]|uniref:DUF1684 domain-containing protein n=1 Tax=Streptomyces sp. NPDC091273 TaxID=3365982 RepID=UPI00382A55D7
MSDDADDPHAARRTRHEGRAAAVSAPYGPLALTGTFPQTPSGGTPRLADYPEGRIPAVPGLWRATDGGAALTATAEDALCLDGEPFTGDAVLAADGGFRPYPEDRRVQVENADGRARGLGFGGEPTFPFQGAEHTLQVAVDEDDGSLRAAFGDATGGRSSYRFRFLKPGIPDAGGAVTVDFNRSPLPPCAFADHFIRPFPPPGNTLPFEVAAGRRRLKAALATGI